MGSAAKTVRTLGLADIASKTAIHQRFCLPRESGDPGTFLLQGGSLLSVPPRFEHGGAHLDALDSRLRGNDDVSLSLTP